LITPVEKNPLWPLPANYPELNPADQRRARVNGLRQYLLVKRKERGDAFAACLAFFDRYYLQATEHFDPLFYKSSSFVKEPPWHRAAAKAMGAHRLLGVVAPRGSAKSYLLRKAIMLRALAEPNIEMVYFTSTDALARKVGDELRFQLYKNERIQEDFGAEYGSVGKDATMQPSKGDMPTGVEHFALLNNTHIYFRSMMSRQRGLRPDLAIIDDPEYDESASTSMQVLRDNMERAVTSVIMPMVMHKGTQMWWFGTFVSKRHYLWHLMETEEIEVGGVSKRIAKDPRFNKWYRMLVEDCWYDEKGRRRSFWPHQHPANLEECELYGIDPDDVQTLEDIEAQIGSASYSTEYRGRPGEGGTNFFPQIEKEKHGWVLEGADPFDPLRKTDAVMKWWRKSGSVYERVQMPVREFCEKYARIMLLDTSYTNKPSSDRKTAVVMAITEKNERFVLDAWSDICTRQEQVKRAFMLAKRWRVAVMMPEAVKEGLTLYQELVEAVATKSVALAGVDYFPAVKKINVGMADKTAKISSLQPLMENGLVKLPWHMKEEGFFKRLFEQFAGFYPDATDGGLEKDDEIDCWPVGTPVLTERGHVPIEDVKVGEKVLTADGWKSVLKNVDTGVQDVLHAYNIEATPHHPIFTLNRGYVELDSLRPDDRVVVCESSTSGRRIGLESRDTLQGSMEGCTIGGQTVAGTTMKNTSGPTGLSRILSRCIGMCGGFITGIFRKVGVSITRTTTPSTTKSKTSNACRLGSILDCTSTKDCETTLADLRSEPIWRAYVREQLNGIAPKKDEHGIVKTLSTAASERHLPLQFRVVPVSSVEPSIPLSEDVAGGTFTAQGSAVTKPQASAEQKEIVKRKKMPTRCLMVEDVKQFFGQGVLGSNTIQMHRFAYGGLPNVGLGDAEPEDPVDAMVGRLKEDNPVDEFGEPLINRYFDKLPLDKLMEIAMDRHFKETAMDGELYL
jgi:hypothetical protein